MATSGVIGIIGGRGVYQLDGLEDAQWRAVGSPFGDPSDELLFGSIAGQRVAFLPRHGRGHRIPPSRINFRANIDALKRSGVTDLISVSAVGSLREDLAPGTFVLVDQFIDLTYAREKSFFGTGLVAHVSMSHPVCARLGDQIQSAAAAASVSVVRGGTYLVIEGPGFSSLAESKLFRSWGCDVIGMTNMPEAKLAREAEICYATVAMVTDFDCWHPEHDHVTVADVVRVMGANSDRARRLLKQAIPLFGVRPQPCPRGCNRALDFNKALRDASPKPATRRWRCGCRPSQGGCSNEARVIKQHIRTIPDQPKKGVMFGDITTLLKHREGFRESSDALAAHYRGEAVEKVAGIDARGFVFGAAVAYLLHVGFVPIRKKGKLPAETVGHDYALEYGTDRIEVHLDAFAKGDRVSLILDDLLATGRHRAEAAATLIERVGAIVAGCGFVVDLPELGGRKRLESHGLGRSSRSANSKGSEPLTLAHKHRTLWLAADGRSLEIIDQRYLPHRFEIATLRSVADVDRAIQSMQVRRAPLIGVTAAYGVCLALQADASDAGLDAACMRLSRARPTAVNLRWALARMQTGLAGVAVSARIEAAYQLAGELCDQEAAASRAIGEQGQPIIQELRDKKTGGGPVHVLTHCNAGWLATVDWGTALAPVYLAHQRGIDVHVWVDETRPRNQGAALTAWELLQAKVPHTVIADNAGGHLMQHGLVDVCLVGSDRTTRRGDVCNKIGTYLKALAAKDNAVPFYAAVPLSTIDWTLADGLAEIPIEERDPREVTEISGRLPDGSVATVKLTPEGSSASNYGFDVTPARLITGIITELGVCKASEEALWAMMPHSQEVGATEPEQASWRD